MSLHERLLTALEKQHMDCSCYCCRTFVPSPSGPNPFIITEASESMPGKLEVFFEQKYERHLWIDLGDFVRGDAVRIDATLRVIEGALETVQVMVVDFVSDLSIPFIVELVRHANELEWLIIDRSHNEREYQRWHSMTPYVLENLSPEHHPCGPYLPKLTDKGLAEMVKQFKRVSKYGFRMGVLPLPTRPLPTKPKANPAFRIKGTAD